MSFSKHLVKISPRSYLSSPSSEIIFNSRYLSTNPKSYHQVDYSSAKPFSELPGPRKFPLIGTSWLYMPLVGKYDLEKQHLAMKDMRKKHGDIFHLKVGKVNFVVSSLVEDLETIIKNEGKYPSRGEFLTLKTYREAKKDFYKTTGLLVLEGKEWQVLRQKTQKHMLKPKSAEGYLEPMQEVAKDFVRRVFTIKDTNDEVPELNVELYKLALESIAYVGLDARLGCLEDNLLPDSDSMRMIQSVLDQFSCMTGLEPFCGNLPIWKYISTPLWRKFVKACDDFTEVSCKYIDKAVTEMSSNVDKDEVDLTLLQCLLMKENLDVSEAVVHLADMIMAGIETTSHSLAYLMYNLAKNPKKQEILYQEIKRILPTKNSRITEETYPEMKYLRACMKESMRFNPVILGAARVLVNDTVIGGYKIPAGTIAAVSYPEIFHDEKYYSNPLEFLPERWLNRDEKPHPFAFLPFGFGVRSCVGKRLAELELVCATSEIIRNFKIEYHHEDIGILTRLVSVPDKPLRFNFIERENT